VRKIVDFFTVVKKDFARMGVDESFCYKKPKTGVSNADERESLRRCEVGMVLGGECPISGTSRGVLGGRISSALRFLGIFVPCVLFPYNAGKTFSHTLFTFFRSEFLNGNGGVELHRHWSWPKRAMILLIGVESGTFDRFNSFGI
jgi:hypothetical protein